MPKMPEYNEVITFWFDEITPEDWFKKDDEFDALIKTKFDKTIIHALAGRLDSWADSDAGCLALIIVLDQFSRSVLKGNESCDLLVSGGEYGFDEIEMKIICKNSASLRNLGENILRAETAPLVALSRLNI